MLEAVNLQAVREGDGGAVSVAFLKSQTQQMQDVKGGENLRTSCYYFPVSTMMGGAHHVLYLAEICGCIPGRMALSKVSYKLTPRKSHVAVSVGHRQFTWGGWTVGRVTMQSKVFRF